MKQPVSIHSSGYPSGQLPYGKSILFTLLAYAIQFAFFTRTMFMPRRKRTMFMVRSITGQSRSRHW